MSITASEARRLLFPLIDQVNADQDAVEIVSKSGTAFLVPADQWRSLNETAYLLSTPANAERMFAALERARSGRHVEHELGELRSLADDAG